MRAIFGFGVGLSLVLAIAACGKKTGLDGARSRLSKADVKVEALQPTDPARFAAQKCLGGSVDQVDVVVCEYGSIDALAAGKRAGEQWLGAAPTGAVLDSGTTLLAVADRAHADPNGRLIHRITKAFRDAQ